MFCIGTRQLYPSVIDLFAPSINRTIVDSIDCASQEADGCVSCKVLSLMLWSNDFSDLNVRSLNCKDERNG
jgi:hypothetical protein